VNGKCQPFDVRVRSGRFPFTSHLSLFAVGIGKHKIAFLNTGWQKFPSTFVLRHYPMKMVSV
jgi:hypothetical protein